MDSKKLLKLIDSLVVLKEKLKCPICLDVIQEVVELDCGHKYCKECYTEHKSTQKQPCCPLCKKTLKRRSSVYCDDVYANSLGKFVHNCSENVRKVYGCEVEQLRQTLNSGKEVVAKRSPEVLKQNVSNEGKTNALHLKSKTVKKEKKKRASSKENQEDAFDKLMNAAQVPSVFNKKGSKRVYTNKKKAEVKPKLEYNILEFDNFENKTAVLQWLNDTRNKFDRLTQTQNFVSEEADIPTIDLDSVSQFKEKVNNKPVVHKNVKLGRAKSLDIEIKKPIGREKRYSDGGGSALVENYDIEDVNTEEEKVCKKAEEKVLLEVIEDEFLNKLEQEMHVSDNERLKSNRKKRNKKNANVPSQASSTGWDRLTKIDKSIKKTERVPKQLHVILQSTHGSETKSSRISVDKDSPSTSKMPNTHIKQDVGKKREKYVSRSAEISNSDNRVLKADGATEDGNTTEINKACQVNEGEVQHKNDNSSEFKRPDLLKPKESTFSYNLKKLEDYIAKNMKAIMSGGGIDEVAVTSPQTVQEKEISKKSTQINEITEQQRGKIHDDTAFEMPTQKIITVNPQCEEKTTVEVIVLNDDEEMEEIYALPTQKSDFRHPDVAKKSSVREDKAQIEESANVENDIDEMYCLPTQEIIHNCKDSHEVLNVQEKCDSVEGLLCLVEDSMVKCLENLQSTDMVVESQLRNLQYYITKLKSLKLYERDDSGKSDSRNVCDASTQTLVATSEQHIQTEVKNNTIGVQTESILCHKCNVDLNDDEVRPKLITQGMEDAMKSMLSEPEITFKPVTQPKTSKAPSQNDIFTASFDDLNFETQDLTKKEASVVRNTKNSPKVATLPSKAQASPDKAKRETKPTLPSSVLVCSLTPSDSKKVNRRLNFEGDKSKKFKRIRTLTDSESEDEPDEKRLCNRFVRDDLTIEFQTNTERAPTQNESRRKALDSQDSENINYDEYLAQIMKKYDTNNPSSGSSKSIKEPVIPTPDKELMRKCEEMLEKSTKGTKNIRKICGFTSDSSKDSYRTASDSVNNNEALTADKMFMDEHNLSKLEKVIQNYEQESVKVQNSESTDIISSTEEEPVVKKFRRNNAIKNNSQLASLFCQSQNDDVHMQEPEHNSPVTNNPESDSLFGRSENPNSQAQAIKGDTIQKKNPESASLFCETEKTRQTIEPDQICIELDDSFDDGDLENIDIPDIETKIRKEGKNREGKIQILGDVVIRSPIRAVDDEDEILSDEDIVETTPQKKIDSFGERCGISQLTTIDNPLITNLTVPKSDTENFAYDFLPLPPPPDFQDDNDPASNDMEDIISVHGDDDTVTNLNKGLLTPDRLSQFIVRDEEAYMSQILSHNIESAKDNQDRNNLSLTPDKLSQLDVNPVHGNLSHSSPIADRNVTRDTLGFSPIPLKKTPQLGITEMAAAAKYTPLSSVSRHTPQKQNLFTSTPRQKSIWNYVKPSQPNELATPTKTKPCIACTRLTKEQIKLVSQLTNKKLATYSPQFDSSVTHMIVAVNENNYVKDYTIKFVSAVAAGIWVLRYEWIEECLSNNCIVPEQPFEALDISGIPGPKTARLTRKQNPLFKGFKFFCVEPFLSTTKEEIENILTMLGGKVLKHLKNLLEDDGNIGLIIGEGHATQDFEQFERWVGLYKTVTVDIEWLSKCVGQYKLLSIRPYIWCSEDNLGDLGYPPNLIESVPLSFSETF